MFPKQYAKWIQKLSMMYAEMTIEQLKEALHAWELLVADGIESAECRCKVIKAELKRRQDGV